MIVENNNDAIYIHDFEGNIIDVNHNACRMLGYALEELVGSNLAKIDNDWRIPAREDLANATPAVDDQLRLPVQEDLERLILMGHAIFERENIHKDGTIVPVEVNVRIVSSEGKGIAMTFVRDISERKRMEEEKQRYEKLQGVLEMSGAICHELNQPLQIISGYSELLLTNISENNPIHGKLATIRRQIERMGSITNKLMMIKDYETQDYAGFSRIVDINKSVDQDH